MMIFKSRDFTYEVIRKLDGNGNINYWQSTCLEDASGYFLVQFHTEKHRQTVILRILELHDNPAFTDIKEYFMDQETIIVVFPHQEGQTLQEYLAQDTDPGLYERFSIGQRLIERLIFQQVPLWLMAEALNPACVYPLAEPVGVRYMLDTILMETPADWKSVQERLQALAALIFARESDSGLYPETDSFCQLLCDKDFESQGLAGVYQAYLELMPVCTEERLASVEEKKPLPERLKQWGTKLLTVIKLLMGAAVLLVVVTMVPSWWQEQVIPVWNAGKLWKAVYVDGETLPQETEPETVEEPEADPDNGFVTRYWDNGNVCYKGNMADGLYEGKGTKYYSNGAVEYQGEFSFGKKEGDGSLYTPEGVLLYEGGFKRDRYEGEGRLYDESGGNLIYDGGFKGGKYDGTGILYHPLSEFPLYDGTFRRGFYDGQGVEYDSNGARLYEGDFLLGVYHGSGIYYDASTGIMLMEGEFRNGMLILSEGAGLSELVWEDEPGMGPDEYGLASPSDATEKGVDHNEGTGTSMVVPEAG